MSRLSMLLFNTIFQGIEAVMLLVMGLAVQLLYCVRSFVIGRDPKKRTQEMSVDVSDTPREDFQTSSGFESESEVHQELDFATMDFSVGISELLATRVLRFCSDSKNKDLVDRLAAEMEPKPLSVILDVLNF